MAGPPFNINETDPAANSVVSAYPANERANRATIEDWLSFISDPTTGDIRPEVLPESTSIDSGSKTVFQQTAAPTGWTKDVTHNNKALRVVTGAVGSGGTQVFTTAFSSKTPAGTVSSTTATGTIGATALTTANLPSHTHTFTTSTDGAHTHTYGNAAGTENPGTGGILSDSCGPDTMTSSSAGAHTHSGTTAGTGSGATHNHTFTGISHDHTFTGTAINLAVQYVDFILATKD